MKRINVFIVFVLLLFHMILPHVNAEVDNVSEDHSNVTYVYAFSEEKELIPLYEWDDEEPSIVKEIESLSRVLVLEERDGYSLVEVILFDSQEEEENLADYKTVRGYINNDALISEEEVNALLNNEKEALSDEDVLEHPTDTNAISSESNKDEKEEIKADVESDVVEEDKEAKDEKEEQEIKEEKEFKEEEIESQESDESVEQVKIEEEKEEGKAVEEEDLTKELLEEEAIQEEGMQSFSMFSMSAQVMTTNNNQQLRGVALRAPTNVVESPSTNAKVLRSYNKGHILRYSPYNSNWHRATVYLNGAAHTGYIHTSDVDTIVSDQVNREGYAIKSSTPVYSQPVTNSEIVRTYNQGHLLKFKTFSSQWYEATVYINGTPRTGYIHVNDIGSNPPTESRSTQLQGVALASPTNVYSQTSRSSNVLRSYNAGHLLRFNEYNSEWYIATVILNNVPHTGYIHVNDVDRATSNQQDLEGVAIKQVAHVYSSTSRNSNILRSYNKGSILKFRSFTSEWYQATVILNGVRHTGYIHKNDVGPVNQNGTSNLRGVALKGSTHVYASTSRNSSILRSYNEGHILQYRAHSTNWFQATVILNGTAHTGYIHMDDVETADAFPMDKRGIALNQQTHVYSSASTSSTRLRSYNQGHILQYRSFTSEWYQATVILNGKRHTGYIHASHVETLPQTQAQLTGAANVHTVNVYSRASRSAGVLRSYSYGSRLIYKTFTSEWYEATVYVNGTPRTGYIHKNDVISLQGKTIILDPGHGAHDSGAIANGMREKDLVLDISLRAEALLRNAGANVIMTRRTDVFLTLAERAALANSSNADIFISVHANAFNGQARGTETFWHGKYEVANSIRLAHSLQDAVVSKMGTHYRRVDEGNFHVIRETRIPSALLEVGFMDHPDDAAKLRSNSYRQLAAEGIYVGVLNYFN